MPNDDENTVSFRLPPEIHEKLVQLAADSDLSKHKAARMLVTRSLQVTGGGDPTDQVDGLEEAFAALLANLADLRMGVGRGVGAILQHVAPDRDKEEIRKWVFDRIISPSTPHGDAGGD